MKRVGAALSGLLMMAVALSATAKDIGTFGNTFEIKEEDLVVRMMKDAAKVDWKSHQTQLAEDTKSWFTSAPQQPLARAEQTRTFYVDPTLVIQQDIPTAAMETGADGKKLIKWSYLARKGQRVNPLEQGMAPVSRMLFFNPSDPSQREFALAAWRSNPLNIYLVATGGNLRKLMDEIKYPVFYSYPWMISKFQLKTTPSLVGVGKGRYAHYMAVTEFGRADLDPKTAAERVREAWNGLPDADQN